MRFKGSPDVPLNSLIELASVLASVEQVHLPVDSLIHIPMNPALTSKAAVAFTKPVNTWEIPGLTCSGLLVTASG